MFLDSFLISSAESLAGGADIHHLANMIAAYKGAYYMALDSGLSQDISLFEEAEKELIAFIAKKKVESVDDDSYVDEERYKEKYHKE